MTIESRQDMQMLQTYIRKLQEIRTFLQRANAPEGSPQRQMKVNEYWQA